MAYNGNTIPSGRDNTYDSSEVHRKSSEERYETAFNDDQKKVLDNFTPSGGGSGSLPEVTSEDNGKVLTVVDGAWDKAENSGGGGGTELPRIVTSVTFGQTNVATIDKTYEELVAMVGSKTSILAIVEETITNASTVTEYIANISKAWDTQNAVILNRFPLISGGEQVGQRQRRYTKASDGTVTYQETTYPLTK